MVDLSAGAAVKNARFVLSPVLSIDSDSHGSLVQSVHDIGATIVFDMSIDRFVLSVFFLTVSFHTFI